ncbi:MAG: hypothetical protein COS99_03720 [Candidatus Omnitrophica bacterium CG07_land_8_20_14_0_80_42_15]|uniref:Regulatory protein RecX n=1 Tax=Candidatus Aquitaenariimonas noxiae TaxID=1974741 RepID=A0A2J0KTN6_9BACT|nr:MAG: hypothetical protein COS99_03720 [Candidatus Omnitrophica bacterium CG07_land_8_20_14_0_80_42_15]
MQLDPDFKQALGFSYQLLSYRPRSIYEIRIKLEEKGYKGELIDKVIERLKGLHYLDDKNFAKFWVEAKMKLKPVGSMILKRDLEERGIEEALIGEAIKDKETDYDEFKTAYDVAEAKLATYGKIHKLKAMKRIYDYLVRRGFKFDIIRQVLDELFKK